MDRHAKKDTLGRRQLCKGWEVDGMREGLNVMEYYGGQRERQGQTMRTLS